MLRFLFLALFVTLTSAFNAPAMSPKLIQSKVSMNAAEEAAKRAWLAKTAPSAGPPASRRGPRARYAAPAGVMTRDSQLAPDLSPPAYASHGWIFDNDMTGAVVSTRAATLPGSVPVASAPPVMTADSQLAPDLSPPAYASSGWLFDNNMASESFAHADRPKAEWFKGAPNFGRM